MSQAEFIGMFVSAAVALVGFVTPILKLNSSITKLNLLLDRLNVDLKEASDKVAEHEHKIHAIELTQVAHENRINNLEGGTRSNNHAAM